LFTFKIILDFRFLRPVHNTIANTIVIIVITVEIVFRGIITMMVMIAHSRGIKVNIMVGWIVHIIIIIIIIIIVVVVVVVVIVIVIDVVLGSVVNINDDRMGSIGKMV